MKKDRIYRYMVLGQGRYGEPRLFARGHGALEGAAHTDTPLGGFIRQLRAYI